MRRLPVISICGALTAAAVVAFGAGAPGKSEAAADGARTIAQHTNLTLDTAYGKLPLGFEKNQGQSDVRVRFLSRGPGYTLFLTDTGAVLRLHKPSGGEIARREGVSGDPATRSAVLEMGLDGANASPRVAGMDPLETRTNYFRGNDPAKWVTDIASFERVRYEAVYPGIDLVYYDNGGKLEYDFVVAPQADPSLIGMTFTGTRKVALDASGNLNLHTPGGVVVQHAPVAYQVVDGERRVIDSRYRLDESGRVSFQLAAYDKGRELIIDPVLVYATFLGGSGSDSGISIAVDKSGNAYVTGSTGSADFPVVRAFDEEYNISDTFVVRLTDDGTRLTYATYLGGSRRDLGLDIAVDDGANVILTGITMSTDFPVTGNAVQPNWAGGYDAFLVKLGPSGNRLEYGTYLGGGGSEYGESVALGKGGDMYIAGSTQSLDFPTTPGAFQVAHSGGWGADAFVTRINNQGNAMVYSTYVGGWDEWDEALAVAVDDAGSAYITGDTTAAGYPTTPGSYMPEPSVSITEADWPVSDVFVTKLGPDGSSLVYSTFLGSDAVIDQWGNRDVDGEEEGKDIAVDADGHAYVTGFTDRPSFPTTPGAFQTYSTAWGGKDDVFVTKFSPDGSSLVYSTYIGGNTADPRQEFGTGIALDDEGNTYITGWTSSSDFPVVNPVQATIGTGRPDAFATKLNADGSALLFSTFLGGSGPDRGWGIDIDACGNIYGTGLTQSPNFPVTPDAVDTTCGTDGNCNKVYWSGRDDAYVFRIGDTQCGEPNG